MKFKDFIRKLVTEVPADWWDEDITIEDLGSKDRKTFLIDLDNGDHEFTPTVHIMGTDLPIEQFPYGVNYPAPKPDYWDEYLELKERGLFPTGHEELT